MWRNMLGILLGEMSYQEQQKDVFWIAPIVVMIIGAFDMPLGYYNLSRLVVRALAH